MSTVRERCRECIRRVVKGAALPYYLKLLEEAGEGKGWNNIFKVPADDQEPCPWCKQVKEIKSDLLVSKL